MEDLAILTGLFAAAFVAATFFPAQSEVLLVAALLAGEVAPWLLVAVASLGNVLGAVVHWALGRGIERFRGHRWFPLDERKLDRAVAWYHRYGRWSLLLSWAPFIGDPLTLVAGVLREPLWSFLAIVALAKTLRYLVLAAVTLNWV